MYVQKMLIRSQFINNFFQFYLLEYYGTTIFKIKLTTTSGMFGYDIKQSDAEAPWMLELCRIRSTSLLQSLQDPL